MRRIKAALIGALAGALVAATPSQTPEVLVDGNQISATDEVERAFEDFIQRFRKNYTAAEREVRFAAFKENYNTINEHNRGNHSYAVGINVFADLTHEEFSRTYLASNSTLLMQSPYQGAGYLGVHAPDNLTALPQKVDWVAAGAVTAVKDQGHCGGCWAFSATGALEGAWKIATQHLVSLSEQQIIDCSYQSAPIFQGCSGGNPIVAFDWLRDRALCNEASYQFVDGDGFDGTYSCSRSCRITIASGGVHGFKIVPQNSDQALMDAVANHGPVSVALEADRTPFMFYRGGVLSGSACFASHVDHAVLVVGYGTDSDGGDYWMVKNSWGPTWGENGYIRIARGGGSSGVCGILTAPAYPVVDGSKAVPADTMISIILAASFLGCCCLSCLYCGCRHSSCCRRRPVQRAPLLAGPPPSGGARTIVAPQQPRALAFSVPPQAAAVPGVPASQVRTGNSAGSRLLQQQQQQQMQQLQNARSGGQARVQPSANQALRNP